MVPDFTNKVVLVTGASAGIGEAIALLFAKLGAKLAIVGRDAGNLGSVAKRCQAEKGLAPLAIVADLATDVGCDKTAKDTLAHYGRLDVLINNAGVGARTCIQNADMETFDRVFNTNVRGVYNLTRQLVPALIKSKGNIVNISSIAGTCVTVGSLPYPMSKAALDHFSKLIALELAPLRVRVNTVSPGVTVSKFVQRLTDYNEKQYQDWLKNASGSIPLGRVCSGEDIAKMVAHLASDELSALVTGTVVEVDGGMRFGNIGGLVQSYAK
ncbi:3-oxoacyl-[acyl-carrier-protein] reductase FabG-like [Ostrinia nubilalis]|uniref:3-oxoacyl-[acyl-carrier-protein] reductase FabG-like n=1 Tax=Ostrinia nubilalis TaxID=29057 RepID=UPI0030822302